MFRWGLWLGVLIGGAWALRRTLLLRRAVGRVEVSRDPWTPIATIDASPVTATPADQAPVTATPSTPRTWLAAVNGACPADYPVKAKVSSRVYRLPGMPGYEKTRPERCYRSEQDAIADGFTRAKR